MVQDSGIGPLVSVYITELAIILDRHGIEVKR